tara:strand:- start:1526 stop:2311 length:786 start_codon:yes stop_codon:yes gene_type:complete
MAQFLYKQLIASKLAKNQGINNIPGVDVDSDPTLTEQYIINNLQLLFSKCVSPLMNAFPEEIGITSAYRCKALNAAIKPIPGVKNSLHTRGQAVDLISVSRPSSELWNWCYNNLPDYYQIIWEYPELGVFKPGKKTSWIHISYKEDKNIKINSVASKLEILHKELISENTYRKGNYTHGINSADENLISSGATTQPGAIYARGKYFFYVKGGIAISAYTIDKDGIEGLPGPKFANQKGRDNETLAIQALEMAIFGDTKYTP